MIFDQLCKFAERFDPDLSTILDQSNLFHFNSPSLDLVEEVPHDLATKGSADRFFLPFPITAVEDHESIIILADTIKNATGLEPARRFWECMPIDRVLTNKDAIEADKQSARHIVDTFGTGCLMLSRGIISEMKPIPLTLKYSYRVELQASILYSQSIGIKDRDPHRQMWSEFTAHAGRNVATAIEEISLLNVPKRFVVENIPPTQKKKKKILRSHQRSNFTLLTIEEIKKNFGLTGQGEGGSKAPHPRRRHTRTLSDGRETNVKACWVGESEVQVGKGRYKVRTDL